MALILASEMGWIAKSPVRQRWSVPGHCRATESEARGHSVYR